MKRIITLLAILGLMSSCENSTTKNDPSSNTNNSTSTSTSPSNTNNTTSSSNNISAKSLNWYCSRLIKKPVANVRSILGNPTDCYNCTEIMGEIQYYNAVTDAMGVPQTLKIHYYDGIVTWLQYGSSQTYTDDGRACR